MAQGQQTTLLEAVKKNIRITHNALDDAEIVPLIQAAEKELESVGVAVDEADPLIARAVTTYVKAHFGYDNPDAERFERVFNSLLNKLSQMGEYAAAKDGGAGG